jgi:hypothetical protein
MKLKPISGTLGLHRVTKARPLVIQGVSPHPPWQPQDKHQKSCKRAYASSGSSLLEPAYHLDRVSSVIKKRRVQSFGSAKRLHTRRNKTQGSRYEYNDPIAVPPPSKETFKKRHRHKTREDRYEIKNGKDQAHREHRVSKATGAKRRCVRNSSRPGERLMQGFDSKHIVQDRLTVSHLCTPLTMFTEAYKMNPSHSLGLFKKGRASSPRRRCRKFSRTSEGTG